MKFWLWLCKRNGKIGHDETAGMVIAAENQVEAWKYFWEKAEFYKTDFKGDSAELDVSVTKIGLANPDFNERSVVLHDFNAG